jgi:hypothetical protein
MKFYLYRVDPGYKSLKAHKIGGSFLKGYSFEKISYERKTGAIFGADKLYFSPLIKSDFSGFKKSSINISSFIYNSSAQKNELLKKPLGKFTFLWPAMIDMITIERILFQNDFQAQDLKLSKKGCSIAAINAGKYWVSNLDIDFSWKKKSLKKSFKRSFKSSMESLSGSFVYDKNKIDICIVKEADDFICDIASKAFLPGGLKLNLVWYSKSNQLKSRIRLKAKGLADILKKEIFKSDTPFELYGDITWETHITTDVFKIIASGTTDFKQIFNETSNTFFLAGNSLAIGKKENRKVFKKVTGRLEMQSGNIVFENVTLDHSGYSFTVKGSCTGNKILISAQSSAFFLNKNTLSTRDVQLPDYFDLNIKGILDITINLTIGQKKSLRSKYRYTSQSGSVKLFDRNYTAGDFESAGTAEKKVFSCRLKWKDEVIFVDGAVQSGDIDISFSSSGMSIYNLKKIVFEKKAAVKGNLKIDHKGYSVSANVDLNDNSVLFMNNRFTGVKGIVNIDDKGLSSSKIQAVYKSSPFDLENLLFNFQEGEYSFKVSSIAARADDLISFLKDMPLEKSFNFADFSIEQRVSFETFFSSKKEGKSFSSVLNFHENPFSIKKPALEDLLKKIKPHLTGKIIITNQNTDLSGLTVHGRDPIETSRIFSAKVELSDSLQRCLILKIDTPPAWGVLQALGVKLPINGIEGEKLVLSHAFDSEILNLEFKKLFIRASGGFKARIDEPVLCIDTKKRTLKWLKGGFYKGRIVILECSEKGAGLFSAFDFNIEDLFEYNGYPLKISGIASFSGSLVKDRNMYRGPLKMMLKKGSLIKNFMPEKISQDFFKSPFLDPLEINWFSFSGRIDTSSQWILSTFDEDSFLDEYKGPLLTKELFNAFRGMEPMYLKLDTDKVKLAGNYRIKLSREQDAVFAAQFPQSVSSYVNLGPYRTFFTQRGEDFVQFRNRAEKVVYLPFRVSGKLDEPEIKFDPEKHILRKMGDNPLKLFNFIIPNIF